MVIALLVGSTLPPPTTMSVVPRKPAVVVRSEWGALPVGPGAKPHEIRLITIHHGGVAANPTRPLEDKLRGLQAFSQREDKLASGKTKPAWPDIPYHYYIAIDGRIGEGRPTEYAGDTNTEYDPTGHLLIMVEGNFEEELPTKEALVSLKNLTLWCAWNWKVPSVLIQGHRDYSRQTSCPGKNLESELPRLRALVHRWQRPQ